MIVKIEVFLPPDTFGEFHKWMSERLPGEQIPRGDILRALADFVDNHQTFGGENVTLDYKVFEKEEFDEKNLPH